MVRFLQKKKNPIYCIWYATEEYKTLDELNYSALSVISIFKQVLSISLSVSNKNKKQNTKYKQCHIILINLISIYLYIINILKIGFFFFFGVYVGETNKNFFLVITKITHWPLKNEQFSKSTLPPPFSLTETLSASHTVSVFVSDSAQTQNQKP